MRFFGIDIGGANIKLASLDGVAKQIPFPIWKDKHQLALHLQRLANDVGKKSLLGVTMTAELADCFESKQAGVEFIARAVVDSFPHSQPLFYQTDGSMCQFETAVNQWELVAASNWHATAWMAFHENQLSGFCIDVGSTTTDITPVRNGSPITDGLNDTQRLTNSQLIYAGVGRTPVCSLISSVALEQRDVSIAREIFATTADAFIWLGEVPPDESNLNTADGRPATKHFSGQRLARMICADLEELKSQDVDAIAIQTKSALVDLIGEAIGKIISQHANLPLHFRTFGEGASVVDPSIRMALATGDLCRLNVDSLEIKPFSQDATTNQVAPALAVAKRRELVFNDGAIANHA